MSAQDSTKRLLFSMRHPTTGTWCGVVRRDPRAPGGMHRHESRQPGFGAFDPYARLLPGLWVTLGLGENHRRANERLRVRARELRVETHIDGLGQA